MHDVFNFPRSFVFFVSVFARCNQPIGYRGLQGSVVDVGGTQLGGTDDAYFNERGDVHPHPPLQQAQAEDEQDPRLLFLRTGIHYTTY